MARRPYALVIGGSPGGLLAAGMLRAAGCEATVFERAADDLASRGAGLGTRDELFLVTERIGIAVDASIGVAVPERICLDPSGRVTHRMRLPQTMSAWARIYRLLKDALPRERYRPGMALERVEQDAHGVTAVFSGGVRVTGDLLVGADGIRSTVRAQLLPQVHPRYADYVAWRGMLEEREVLARLCTDASGRCHGVAIAPPLIRPELIAQVRSEARASRGAFPGSPE
jgi:2-polyprenyl-6-methoxyphenol hydroxylase-like FAD-dependent oxidoreductase